MPLKSLRGSLQWCKCLRAFRSCPVPNLLRLPYSVKWHVRTDGGTAVTRGEFIPVLVMSINGMSIKHLPFYLNITIYFLFQLVIYEGDHMT